MSTPPASCVVCKKETTKALRCSRCLNPCYILCSTDCQRADWKRHKREECQSLRTELLGTGQQGVIPLLCKKPDDELITRIKSEPPPSDLVRMARKTFGTYSETIFIDEVARFARVCQLNRQARPMISVGTEPNDTLDPAVQHYLEVHATALKQGVVHFYIHRLGRRDRLVDESVVFVERVIQFIQQVTGKDKEGDKLKVSLFSRGGHDSDCIVKKIFDKPNSKRDLVEFTAYQLLTGNSGAAAAAALPWEVMGQEGFYCLECERREYFCGLGEPSEREELIRKYDGVDCRARR